MNDYLSKINFNQTINKILNFKMIDFNLRFL